MPTMPQEPADISEAHAARVTAFIMRRQLALSLQVASVFFGLLFGLPLVNAYFPELANSTFLGFTWTWLLLGILIYPVTVLLSFYFVRNSDRIEAECTRAFSQDGLTEQTAQERGRV